MVSKNKCIIFFLFLVALFSCEKIQENKKTMQEENNLEQRIIPFTTLLKGRPWENEKRKKAVLILNKTEDIDTIFLPYLGYTTEFFKNNPDTNPDIVKEKKFSLVIKNLSLIDYENNIIIVVSRGAMPSAHYHIEVKKLEEYKNRIEIIVFFPISRNAAPEAVTPYHIIKVARKELIRWEGKEIPFVIKDTEGNELPDIFQQIIPETPPKEEVPQSILDILKQKAAEKSGAAIADIEIKNSAVANYEFLNKKIYSAKVMNIKTGDGFGISIDTEGNVVDEKELSNQENLLAQQKNIKPDRVWPRLKNMEDHETVMVAISLNGESELWHLTEKEDEQRLKNEIKNIETPLLTYLQQQGYEITSADEFTPMIYVTLPKFEIINISTREDVKEIFIPS